MKLTATVHHGSERYVSTAHVDLTFSSVASALADFYDDPEGIGRYAPSTLEGRTQVVFTLLAKGTADHGWATYALTITDEPKVEVELSSSGRWTVFIDADDEQDVIVYVNDGPALTNGRSRSERLLEC